ncbi:MAG: hypothetical protein JSU64_06035 [candidate division WOR-3 bacterium]|nr:MAG: hypothetical protein JSU64_06035 [candidate division WOR-3 bacterium]
MRNFDIILRAARRYARKQSIVDFLALLIFVCAAVVVSLTVALFLLKSPLYGLIGVIPLLFFRPGKVLDRARQLQKKAGLKDEIVSSLQLAQIPEGSKENYSRELIQAFIDETAIKIRGMKVEEYVSYGGAAAAAKYLLVALGFALIFPASFPQRFWYSLNHRIEYRVSPGSAEYPKDTQADISLQLWGVYVPKYIELKLSTAQKTDRQKLRVNEGIARTNVTISETVAYRFSFLEYETETYELFPLEPLRIENLTFRLRYPARTGMSDDTVTGRQLVAPSQTVVYMEGRVSEELRSARFEYGDTLDLDHEGRNFRGRFTVKESGTALLSLSGRSSLQEQIRIYSIPDLAPVVDIFYPGTDVNLPRDMKLEIGVRCSDDYGLSGGFFYYTFDKEFVTSIAVGSGVFEDTVVFNWDLSELGMLPGDEVTYYAVIRDNSGQMTRSSSYRVYFPTMEQMYDEVSEKETMLQTDIARMQSEHGNQMKETARIQEKMMKEREFSWADQEQLREAIRREEAILDKVNEWQAELEQTIEKLKEGVLLDPKSIERLNEIARILEEIAPHELRKALEELRLAMEQRPDDLPRALEQLQQRQEELARALERSLEILRRYEQEEKLREYAEKAQQLAEQQEMVEELFGRDEEDAAEKQHEIDQAMEELLNKISELASSEGLEQEIREALEQMAMQLRQMSSANMAEKKSGLKNLAMGLQQLYEKLTQGRFVNLRKDLIESLKQTIEASKAQEDIIDRLNTGAGIDQGLQQDIIRATETIAESLFQQQSKSFFVGPHISKGLARATLRMKEAQTAHKQDRVNRVKATEAMKELNLVARDILFALKMMVEDGSSTGMNSFMQQLSDITQGQMTLSQSLMNILPIPMPGLSQAQKAQLERLAGRQRALREALQSLKGEAAAGKYQHMLDAMIDEMMDIEEALFQYKVDRELIERQKRVISRLLDSQRSIRKEDYAEKRESKPGQAVLDRPPPAPLSERLGKDELRELLQQELRKSFPREYEIYIREYFKALLGEK